MSRKTDPRRKPVARAVPRKDDAPVRADAVLVTLAIWLSLATGGAALEHVKLPPMPPASSLPPTALYAGF